MKDAPTRTALDDELRRLETRVADLVALIERLREENRSLRDSQDTLATERANLLARNEQVRIRVEAMIHRLRALEQNA
jgi:cell division protein ZapB